MDAPLLAEVTASKNIKAALVNEITGVADSLKDNNVGRDSLKTSTKAVTADGIK